MARGADPLSRTTKGASGDWEFDPDFDLTHAKTVRSRSPARCHSIRNRQTPAGAIHFNGGTWPMSCDTPEWDINDARSSTSTIASGRRRTKSFPTITQEPAGIDQLARTRAHLTYNVYAGSARTSGATCRPRRIIADFARENPDRFVGVSLDATHESIREEWKHL
jgi:hypothetical protein